MHSFTSIIRLGGIVACFLLRAANADCPDLPGCDAIAPPPDGENAGIDPKDPNLLGVWALVCPCNVGEVLDLTVTYTGIDQQTTMETTSTTVAVANSESTFTYSFTGHPTDIQSGSPISLHFGAHGLNYPYVSQIYSPVTSIFYVEETMTYTTTETDTTTSTSTTTMLITSNVPQQTSTIRCTTGTHTHKAPTSTSTIYSTITPAPTTTTVTKHKRTTTKSSCVKCSVGRKRQSRAERQGIHANQLEPRAGPVTAETLWIPSKQGQPPATYITTNTISTQITTTTTETDIVTSSETDTVTNTPDPLTTTVCSNVVATVTSTPTATTTISTTLHRRTITSTTTITCTFTQYPHHPPVCTRPPHPFPPPKYTHHAKPIHLMIHP